MKRPRKNSSTINEASIRTIRGDRRVRLVFLALFLTIACTILYIFRLFLWPLLFAVVFYVALKPIHDRIHRRIKTQWVCVTLTVSFFILLVVIPLLALLLALADQAFQFYLFLKEQFDIAAIRGFIYNNGYIHTILDKLHIGQADLLNKIMEMLQNFSKDMFSSITNMVGFSIRFIANFFFMILILSSIFMAGPRIGRMMYDILPFPRDIEQTIFGRLREVIRVLVAGNLVIMVLQGVCVSLGFLIFGIDMPLLAGAAAMIFSLLPVIGTSIVWLPAVVYLSAKGEYADAALLSGWCLCWYLFLENWVKAKFFGKKLNFHPVVFFLLLIASIKAFSLPGVILGPVLLSLFFALWEIYHYIYIESGNEGSRSPCIERTSRRN